MVQARCVFAGGRPCFVCTALRVGKDEDTYSTSRRVRTWSVLVQVIITVIFAAFSASPIWSPHSCRCAVHLTCDENTMPVCMLMSSMTGIVLNTSAGAITDHSQSVKVIDSFLKYQLCKGARLPKTGNHFTK